MLEVNNETQRSQWFFLVYPRILMFLQLFFFSLFFVYISRWKLCEKQRLVSFFVRANLLIQPHTTEPDSLSLFHHRPFLEHGSWLTSPLQVTYYAAETDSTVRNASLRHGWTNISQGQVSLHSFSSGRKEKLDISIGTSAFIALNTSRLNAGLLQVFKNGTYWRTGCL